MTNRSKLDFSCGLEDLRRAGWRICLALAFGILFHSIVNPWEAPSVLFPLLLLHRHYSPSGTGLVQTPPVLQLALLRETCHDGSHRIVGDTWKCVYAVREDCNFLSRGGAFCPTVVETLGEEEARKH
jgi:hypothetical protein